MKLKQISFKNYKAFAEEQTLELRPITILIGKNSSGKSAIAKLPTLLENSLSGKIDTPLLLINNGVELGGDFRDLVYKRDPSTPVELGIEWEDGQSLSVKLIRPVGGNSQPIINQWFMKNDSMSISLEYKTDGRKYIDNTGKEYTGDFYGFIPMDTKFIQDQGLPIKRLGLGLNVDYIGPFRRMPPRTFSLTGQQNYPHTGIKGENAYNILGNSKVGKTELITEVGNWYEKSFDGWRLDVEKVRDNLLEIVLKKGDDFSVNIADVGQGMSQVLPLITRAHKDSENTLVVLEQPELHLHPAAHGDLAELFAYSAMEKKQRYLIETHSENFLLRLRKLIVDEKSKLTPEDVMIYWIDEEEDGQSKFLKPITINEEGRLSDWPEGVFNEDLDEVLAIKKALKNKRTQK